MSAPQGLPGIMAAIVAIVLGLDIYQRTGSWILAGLTTIVVIILFFIGLCIWVQWAEKRDYKVIEGKAWVKERGKDWKPLKEHLRKEHPEEYSKIYGIDKEVKK